ncbi:MAG: type II toxin-antitoxin system HicA family toxin [Solirubrobacteraceae bacterium]
MSRLPAVSGKQLIKILESQDWYVKRIRGSYHILRHPTIPDALPVPVHGSSPIKPGTLGNILRTAGIGREAFQKLLRRASVRAWPAADTAQPDHWVA